MYINTNISALQSVNDLQTTQGQLSNVLQQLSSGYQINNAANNPAGLAISQQMQSQVDGLNQAGQNAQSGISMLQTADGALSNVDSILQSMYSLASQAATGTNNPTDLQALQSEMNQYAKEITTITNTTQFNTLNLLSGAFGGGSTPKQSIQIGANSGQELSIGINAMDAKSLGVVGFQVNSNTNGATLTYSELGSGLAVGTTYAVAASYTAASWTGTGVTVSSSSTMTGAATLTYSINVTTITSGSTTTYTYSVQGSDGYSLSIQTTTALSSFTLNDQTGGFNTSVTIATSVASGFSASITVDAAKAQFGLYAQPPGGTESLVGTTVTVRGQNALDGEITAGGTSASGPNAGELAGFQLSSAVVTSLTAGTAPTTPTATSTFTVALAGQAAVTTGNGVVNAYASANSGLDISSQASAANALSVLNNAITAVNQQRANIGAYQNRLQFAASNASTSSSNLSSAQAGIMDTNVALATAQLSQYQILQQSGIAMLAQANAIPQALLKLFP